MRVLRVGRAVTRLCHELVLYHSHVSLIPPPDLDFCPFCPRPQVFPRPLRKRKGRWNYYITAFCIKKNRDLDLNARLRVGLRFFSHLPFPLPTLRRWWVDPASLRGCLTSFHNTRPTTTKTNMRINTVEATTKNTTTPLPGHYTKTLQQQSILPPKQWPGAGESVLRLTGTCPAMEENDKHLMDMLESIVERLFIPLWIYMAHTQLGYHSH